MANTLSSEVVDSVVIAVVSNSGLLRRLMELWHGGCLVRAVRYVPGMLHISWICFFLSVESIQITFTHRHVSPFGSLHSVLCYFALSNLLTNPFTTGQQNVVGVGCSEILQTRLKNRYWTDFVSQHYHLGFRKNILGLLLIVEQSIP